MLDLTQFCDRHQNREITKEPFTVGQFSYATNGRVLVRVPKREDIPEKPEFLGSVQKVWENYNIEKLITFKVKIPTPKREVCNDCNYGSACHCDTCSCKCETCDGTGMVEQDVYVDIRGVNYNAKYLRQIQNLPNLKLNPVVGDNGWFLFDGGEGTIMPVNYSKPKIIAEFNEV